MPHVADQGILAGKTLVTLQAGIRTDTGVPSGMAGEILVSLEGDAADSTPEPFLVDDRWCDLLGVRQLL